MNKNVEQNEIAVEKMTIKEKLLHIQTELKAPKNQFNEYGGFKYRSCEDILEGLKPLLDKYHCMILIQDFIEQIGQRFYVKAVVEFHDLESREGITCQAYAREPESKAKMDDMQLTGSASSYARKYALNGLFMIDDTNEIDSLNNDNQNQNQQPQEQKTQVFATPSQCKMIVEQMSAKRIEQMLNFYKKNKVEQLSLKEASDVLNGLKKEKENGNHQSRK